MSTPLPMFPLSTVVFPGVSLPLHVFEDRYRALVHHLMRIDDPAERVFGTVAVREGYEVGDHGSQSLYRVGVRLQLTDVEANDDGTFEIEAVAPRAHRARGARPVRGVRRRATSPSTPTRRARCPRRSSPAPAPPSRPTGPRSASCRATTFSGSLPRDPGYLSWTLAALAPLPMAERQSLLEADSPRDRLELVTSLLREELRAINVIPSLPATEVARTAWSPN